MHDYITRIAEKAADNENSFDWRQDFIGTFLERDIPALGLTIPSKVMERLWLLLSHIHGQIINYSKLADTANGLTRLRKGNH